jgi:hypothetical protein
VEVAVKVHPHQDRWEEPVARASILMRLMVRAAAAAAEAAIPALAEVQKLAVRAAFTAAAAAAADGKIP